MHIIKSSKRWGGVNLVADIQAWRINESLYGYFWQNQSREDHHWWGDDLIATIIKFNNISREMTAKKSAKKCTAHSEFLFCLFSCFCRHSGSTVLASSDTKQFDTQQFWKTHNKIDIHTYPHRGSFMNLFHSTIIPDCISYQVICMWQNKQRLGRQITSTAEGGCSFQSLQIITCNIKHLQTLKCIDLSPSNTLYWSTDG